MLNNSYNDKKCIKYCTPRTSLATKFTHKGKVARNRDMSSGPALFKTKYRLSELGVATLEERRHQADMVQTFMQGHDMVQESECQHQNN
jgi:hypothetical protein